MPVLTCTLSSHIHTHTGIEDPNFFFQQLMARPYAQNIVWGPHWYAQSVIPFPIPKAFMDVSNPFLLRARGSRSFPFMPRPMQSFVCPSLFEAKDGALYSTSSLR